MYFDYDVLGYIYKRITQESLDIIGFLTINLGIIQQVLIK